MLSQAGFTQIPKRGKDSHTVWSNPFYNGSIILSGKDGKDAQRYQEQQVQKAIREVNQNEP